ncbi:hypothetical protein FOMPIDRAFT_1056393 [Fomitopsis schrenkii]|uniref:GH18 domain-containing protein n=1 Tax=Fomitopsis schrenkii TaxID=2126942 RepID=S8ETD8_FOMSC|nr:hypothetical protein FOMPIDRAFT_1056393 [Fomitopsis schrenkii]
MTYDLHGVWDGNDPWIGSIVLAHTNLTEIKDTLQLFQNVNADWSQVNIGFGFYGRSFELASDQCTTPGCPFTGPADAGPCTNSPGTLSFAEIEAIISSNDLQPVLDEDAAVKYVVWDDRQWVSYDDDETFRLKMDYLNTIVGGSFICEEFLPVPEDWVIPLGQGYGADQPASFTADFDDDIGPSDPNGEGAGSTGIGDDGNENDSPFGEVFITSPNAQSVSSVDVQSDWMLVGCDSKSDQPQTILAYCSVSMNDDDAGCGHVFIGQAEHTIVRMPASCGLGPYARVVSFEVHHDQTVLPAEHQAALPANETVYSLSFDYRFDVIPDENGPIYMRADITDIPGYWDEIIDSAPDSSPTSRKRDLHHKRNFHQPIQYEKRWFGGFTEWLQRLNTVTNGNSISRNFHWSDTYTIYHAEESCPNFASSLDISVSGNAQINSQFGYYLEARNICATVVPPAIQQAYVYVNAGASASATFTMTGLAKAEWSSEAYDLISFGFPGLYYPGLLTLGPSLHLYAQLSGEVSLYGQLSTSVGYTFPSINYAIGSKTDEPTLGSDLTGSTANNNGYNYDFGYNVELSGGFTAYLTPSLELGLTILGGSVMDATAYVQAELYAGLNLNGSVSESQAPQICIQPEYGVNLHGGLKGAVVFWHDQWDHVFYQNSFYFGGACYNSLSDSSRREDLFYNASGAAATGRTLPMQHESPRAFYSKWERTQDVSDDAQVMKHPDLPSDLLDGQVISDGPSSIGKRDTIPYLPGSLFCPVETSDLDQTTSSGEDCICYSDANMDPTNQLIDVLARSYLVPDDLGVAFANSSSPSTRGTFANGTVSQGPPQILVEKAPLRTCPAISVRIPDYSKTNIIAYYDHDDPGTLDPTVSSYTQLPLNLGGKLVTQNGQPVYAREHVYEQSLSSLFIDYLSGFPDLWQTQAGLDDPEDSVDFCTWVQENFVDIPSYTLTPSNSLFTQLGNCYPSTVNGVSTTGLTGITNSMAVLEQTINEIKNTVFYDGERQLITSLPAADIRSTTTWDTYCSQKQVAVLRAAAGIPSFLNQWAVRQEFLKANTCVRNAWQLWYSAYLASTAVDAPNRSQVNVPNMYDNWIAFIMKNIKPFLTSQLNTLVQSYKDTVNGNSGGSPPVDLSFYVLMDNNQVLSKQGQPLNTPATVYTVGQPVSKQDLTNQILNNIPDIMLASQLPTH